MHECLLALSASDLPALVDAEDRLGKPILEQLRAITEECTAHTGAAVAPRPDGLAGHLYLAVNLGIYALTRSHAAGLFEGLPRRIRSAYERAMELDPSCAAGGACLLACKFLMSAPWPVRDCKAAGETLERASETAPCHENYLFLGDLRLRDGRLDDAVAMWQRACETPVKPETAVVDAAVLELARRRVRAASKK